MEVAVGFKSAPAVDWDIDLSSFVDLPSPIEDGLLRGRRARLVGLHRGEPDTYPAQAKGRRRLGGRAGSGAGAGVAVSCACVRRPASRGEVAGEARARRVYSVHSPPTAPAAPNRRRCRHALTAPRQRIASPPLSSWRHPRLLRPRRAFTASSTASRATASRRVRATSTFDHSDEEIRLRFTPSVRIAGRDAVHRVAYKLCAPAATGLGITSVEALPVTPFSVRRFAVHPPFPDSLAAFQLGADRPATAGGPAKVDFPALSLLSRWDPARRKCAA